jgi:hypothetical protein
MLCARISSLGSGSRWNSGGKLRCLAIARRRAVPGGINGGGFPGRPGLAACRVAVLISGALIARRLTLRYVDWQHVAEPDPQAATAAVSRDTTGSDCATDGLLARLGHHGCFADRE